MPWEWPWTAPRKATAPASVLAPAVTSNVDYGPSVHALGLHQQRLDADIRGLKTEWLDHATRLEALVRKMLRLAPPPNGAAPAADPVPADHLVTRADLLRAHRAGGRS